MSDFSSGVRTHSQHSNYVSEPATMGPVFLVGVWRSGTSLLHTLLNLHPDIGLMYEGELPLMRPLFVGNRAKSDWIERWEFWNQAVSRHKLQPHTMPCGHATLAQATENVCRDYARRRGAQIWGCKSPAYYGDLPRLARDFPQARFIVIWRDPIAISRSIRQAALGSRYFRRRGMLLRALLACGQLRRACDQLLSDGFPVHQLQYEDLVRNPELEIRRICNFLGVAFDSRMLSLEEADRSAIYLHDHHASVRSKAIATKVPQANLLSPAHTRKIERYVRRWQRESSGKWPLYPQLETGSGEPSNFERIADAALFRILRVYDQAVLLIYCFIPLVLLHSYRGLQATPKAPVTAQKPTSS